MAQLSAIESEDGKTSTIQHSIQGPRTRTIQVISLYIAHLWVQTWWQQLLAQLRVPWSATLPEAGSWATASCCDLCAACSWAARVWTVAAHSHRQQHPAQIPRLPTATAAHVSSSTTYGKGLAHLGVNLWQAGKCRSQMRNGCIALWG